MNTPRHPFLEIADELAADLQIDKVLERHGAVGLTEDTRRSLRAQIRELRDLARHDVLEGGWPPRDEEFTYDCAD
jgi:hypothetical protein